MSSGEITYDWTLKENEIVTAMIAADNPDRLLTPEMITFGLPNVYIPTDPETYNTTVLITSTPQAPFVGSQYHYYHRVGIHEFVFPETNLVFPIEVISNPDLFAETLSERLGCYLTADKLNYNYPEDNGPLDIIIDNSSLCYLGGLTITVSGMDISLPSVIPNPELDGFYIP